MSFGSQQQERYRMNKKETKRTLSTLVIIGMLAINVSAQDAAEMARKLQDPLANIKMLMFDNNVDLKTGDGDVSYGFSIQPVYAMPAESFNFILRGVFPIVGLAPEAQKPIVGEPLPAGSSDTWGLSDSQIQMFFAPKSDGTWKWGVGPLVSLKTRTDSDLAGAGWGGGAAAVLVGSFSESLSFSMVAGHTEGEDSFSTSFIQPMLFYNVPGVDGMALSYNNTCSYNYNTTSDNAWMVPLGLTVSKTFVMQGGLGVDVGLGYYNNIEKPEGAADWTIKWSVVFVFP